MQIHASTLRPNFKQLLAVASFAALSSCGAPLPGDDEASEHDAEDQDSTALGLTANGCDAASIASVKASGEDGVNVPQNVLDNDLTTRWSSYGKGQWIRLDLGATKSLSGTAIAFWRGAQRTATFDVFVSTDGSSYTKVFSGKSSGTTTNFQLSSFAPHSARYLKVVLYGNSENDWASLTEVRACRAAAAPPPDTGHLIWNGDFETGSLSQYSVDVQCKPDRIKVYSAANKPAGAPNPPSGKTYAVQLTVDNTDDCHGGDAGIKVRTQLAGKSVLTPGLEFWEHRKVYFPSSLPLINKGKFFIAGSDYGPPFDGQGTGRGPSINVGEQDKNTSINWLGIGGTLTGGDAAHYPLPVNQWIDVLWHKKMSNVDDGSGFFEVWVNDSPVVFGNGQTRLYGRTMKYGGTADCAHVTHYRSITAISPTASNPTAKYSIYQGGVKIGTTRESVDF